MQNPFETDELPVFTFPLPPPPPGTGAQRSEHPQAQSFGASVLLKIILSLVFIGGVTGAVVIVFNSMKTAQEFSAPQQTSTRQPQPQPRPQTNSQIASSRGQILALCPQSLKGYASCWGLDLPTTGEWIRWVSSTTAPTTISGGLGISARGCGGEIYDLGKGGQSFNGSCGHLDFRATDGKWHTVYQGVK